MNAKPVRVEDRKASAPAVAAKDAFVENLVKRCLVRALNRWIAEHAAQNPTTASSVAQLRPMLVEFFLSEIASEPYAIALRDDYALSGRRGDRSALGM